MKTHTTQHTTHTTPHTTPSLLLSSHLSESCLREFRSRGTQEGHRQRRSSTNCTSTRVTEIVGGCAGLVGALLHLYLDGCLFGCKCSRLSNLELEFRLQVIIFALYYMSVCLESSI